MNLLKRTMIIVTVFYSRSLRAIMIWSQSMRASVMIGFPVLSILTLLMVAMNAPLP